MVSIRVIPACRFLLPVVSAGGVIIKESYCILPKNHLGPHRNEYGGVMVNNTRFYERMGMK